MAQYLLTIISFAEPVVYSLLLYAVGYAEPVAYSLYIEPPRRGYVGSHIISSLRGFPLGLLRASFYSGFYEVSLILDQNENSLTVNR